MVESILDRIQKIDDGVKRVVAALFRTDQAGLARWTDRIWIAGLYLFGATVWGFFLNWGRLGFDIHDWAQHVFLRTCMVSDRYGNCLFYK